MPETTHDADPADEVENEAAPELDGQSTTVEEAMDAATDEEGFADESAYTTPAGSTVVTETTPDDADAPGTRDDE
jgi:hypothetical protein